MNMDRSQKNLERKKDDRTIEYLELKYDTNIQRTRKKTAKFG